MNRARVVRAMVGCAVGSLLVGALAAPPMASAAQRGSVDGKTLSRLVTLNPGTTPGEMRVLLDAQARAAGVSTAAFAAQVLAEAEASVAAASTSVGAAVARSGGSGRTTLGRAQNKGDVFYSPSSTLFINHGHSGIFSERGTIVHAPGSGQPSRSDSADKMPVGVGARKQFVKVSQSERDRAANYASNNLRNRPYNSFFATNRTNSRQVNCSQLTWLAYRESVGKDLDGNRGAGVYPSDIRDSPLVETYQWL